MDPKTFGQLSDSTQAFLSGSAIVKRAEAFEGKYPNADIPGVLNLAQRLATGEEDLSNLPDLLEEEFLLLDKDKQAGAVEFVGQFLLPIASEIGDVVGKIKEWGGDPSAFDTNLPDEVKETPSEFVSRFLDEQDAHLDNETEDEILEELLVQKITGVLERKDIKEALTVKAEDGGLSLEAENVDRLLASLDDEMAKAAIALEPESWSVLESQAMPVSRPVPAKPPMNIEDFNKMILDAAAAMPAPTPKILDGKSTELFEEKDHTDVKKAAAKTETVHQHGPLLNMADAIADIVKTSGVSFANDSDKKRFERIADARLRGVRDAYETRVQLEYPKEKGGLGLSGNVLADLSRVMEDVVLEYERDLAASVAKGKGVLAEKKQKVTENDKALEKRGEQVMDKRYASMTGKAPTESVLPVAPSGARVSLAVSSEQQVSAQEIKIDRDRVKQAVRASAPLPPKAPVSFSPQSIQPSGGRPSVNDVRFTRRLAGPLEEIYALTLVEFRRLSRDPAEAVTKILDKVRLLEEQGYDQKIEAVKAWRASPLSRIFGDLSNEALHGGKTVDEFLKEKRAQKQDVPSDAEWKALFSLNAALRF